jgi:hypothetical protein
LYEEQSGKSRAAIKKDEDSVVKQQFAKQQEELEIQEACRESLEEEKVRHDKHESAHAELHSLSKEGDPNGRVGSCILFYSSILLFSILLLSSFFLLFSYIIASLTLIDKHHHHAEHLPGGTITQRKQELRDELEK